MPARNQKVIVGGLVCLEMLSLLLLAACGDRPNPIDPNYSEPLPDFHPGTYTMELSINYISLETLTYRPYLRNYVGHWELKLEEAGGFSVSNIDLAPEKWRKGKAKMLYFT